MQIEKIFPNAITGQVIEGAFNVYDSNRNVMGFVSGDTFHLNTHYIHHDAALERLYEHGAKVEHWDGVGELFGSAKPQNKS